MPLSQLEGRLRLIGRWFYELRDWIEHGGKSHFVVSTRHASAGAISGYFPEKVAFGAGKKAHAGGVGGCDCGLSEVRFCSRGEGQDCFSRSRGLGSGYKQRLAVFVCQRLRNVGIQSGLSAAGSCHMESRTVGESGEGEGLSAYAEERKKKEGYCGNPKV